MRNTHQHFILAITDRLGDQLTNGSQVMAQAILEELSKCFNLKVIVQQAETMPAEMNAEIIQFDPADENLGDKIEPLLNGQTSLIYNLGNTNFSAEVTAIIHSLATNIPIINHFQLVLPEYAKKEGYNDLEANNLGLNCQLVAERALCNIFPSFSELNRVIRLGWNIQHSNNCVLKNVFVPAREIKVSPVPDASIIFMAAGRFSDYVKGADLLYRAFSQYYEQDQSAHLLIAGDEKRFINLLSGLPETAWTYLGWLSREELHARFRQADVVIVPSRYEPFGLVAIEAMAMGTPVIAMAIDGLSEIIHHDHTGWLTDPNEGSLGLKLAMQQAAYKKNHLPTMGELCQTAVEQEFSLQTLTGQLKKLFDNTIASISDSLASVPKTTAQTVEQN